MGVANTGESVTAMEVICHYPLFAQRLIGANGDDWFPVFQDGEAFGKLLALPPCHFFFEDMEKGNNVAEAAR